ncbi:MAG: hypothetical protein HYZ14_01060 [Bacteroidetes bacterium]|nr:hypothetical protein [Bacteroidota bacterium]
MSDTPDDKNLVSERRGQTLKVLVILSWIFMGLSALGIIFSTVDGQLSPDELEEEKVALLSTMTPEVLEILGESYITDTIRVLEVSNDYFYTLQGLNAANLVLGFYGVMLMFNLKKKGYYFYLTYSIVPLLISFGFFGTGFIIAFGAVFGGLFSLLFCILYAVQLKRMS